LKGTYLIKCATMKIFFLILFSIIPGIAGFGQSAREAQIFTEAEFIQWVKAWHPLVKQANLLTDEAKAGLREARGAFDPKLYADWQQKSFDGKNYFSIGESGFKIPTWYGVEIKGYFQATNGEFLNPENNLPPAGQAVAGIKASLGQGLFIDERRASLQKAKILEDLNEAERRNLINDVLLDAATTYWDWVKSYHEMIVIEEGLRIARTRLRAVAASYEEGETAAVDTLEAFIQVQNREYELNDARLAYRNAGLVLSNFMWQENNVPVEITESLRPPGLDDEGAVVSLPDVNAYLQSFDAIHPQLQFYQLKMSRLEIERRLASEYLKPRIDLEYNLLGDGFRFGQATGIDNSGIENLLLQNYKWALHFSFPLLLRKERGKLELARIKIMDTDLTLQQKRQELLNKVRDAYNEWENTRRQAALYASIAENYRILLDAESIKFTLGESSIFLVNTREQKLIEARLKLVKLRTDLNKNRNKVDWAAGRLGL
jgi:outer membrane protein TolC